MQTSKRHVAIVGAGISGVCTAAHLLKYGAELTVFERASIAGGVWHYDPRASEDPSYPSEIPSVGDYKRSLPGEIGRVTPPPDFRTSDEARRLHRHPLLTAEEEQLEIQFSPPGPCYRGLKNNVPTSLMVSAIQAWPMNTPENTTQDVIELYVQSLAADHGVNEITCYNTRVEEISKYVGQSKWTIRTLTLEKADGRSRLAEKVWAFDSVVIASGHYNLPRVPDIAGLKEWKSSFGNRVIHSKQYRTPADFQAQNVLVIGAGVSALDICRELDGVAAHVFQSVRGGAFDIPAVMLPKDVQRVGEILRFELDDCKTVDDTLPSTDHIPGKAILKDRVLEGIDRVIVATGYITSYPFLPQLHSDTLPAWRAGPDILVTAEGDMTHNLHKDIFFIKDPSLAFVGVPYYTATFSLFDFQAQVVARVLTGRATLPSEEAMRAEYEARVRSKGLGRHFHSLRDAGQEVAYVRDLVDWINRDAALLDVVPMQGHSRAWLDIHQALRERMKALRNGSTAQVEGPVLGL